MSKVLNVLFGQLENNIWLCLLGSVLVALVPLVLIWLFRKLDNELRNGLKPDKKDITLLVVAGIVVGVLTTGTKAQNTWMWINLIVIMCYLVFMSYTDQKTKLVYTSASLVAMLFETVMFFCFSEVETLTVLVTFAIPAAIQLACLLRMIGLGDALIFWNLTIYLVTWNADSVWYMLILVLLSNILFVINAIFVKLVQRNKEKRLPYTLYIAMSAFIVFVIIPVV